LARAIHLAHAGVDQYSATVAARLAALVRLRTTAPPIELTGDIVDPIDIAPKQITTFTFNGREYSLDLSMSSANELAAALAPWMEKASDVNVVGRRTRKIKAGSESSSETDPEERTRIREWARDNGYEIGPRGRISEAILQAFENRDRTPQNTIDTAATPEPAPEPDPQPAGDDTKPTPAERAAIRQWALEQGRDVKTRGPLSPELIRDYRQTHAA
ncbi:histone-like nucleoid-structuring protein Lsr2, partial [Nocardia sp.]|uniref:Lsr2 family DNA-binding protein n=1 Tax=Nocardia sp. TaxID=1821 RepID=UPI002584F866